MFSADFIARVDRVGPVLPGLPFVLSTMAKWMLGCVSAAFHVASAMRKPTVTMMLHLSLMKPLMYFT